MSAAEILDTTPCELDEIQQQWAVGLDEQNQRFGQVCAVIANAHRDSKKRSKPFAWLDFFFPVAPHFTAEPAAPQGPDELTAKQTVQLFEDLKVGLKTDKRKQQARRQQRRK